jgi:Ulp1 family protease
MPVTFRDFKTLKCANWLNEEVVNALISLMPQHVLDTSFFVAVFQEYLGKSGINLPNLSRLLVPINTEKTRWMCAEVDLVRHTVTTYDSQGHNPEPGQVLATVLGQRLQTDFSVHVGKCPEQTNSCDSGVFMLANLSLLALGRPLDYKYLVDMRKTLALRLLKLD